MINVTRKSAKTLCLVIILMIALLTTNIGYASEKDSAEYTNAEILKENAKYSYILDEVNEDYDTSASMMTQKELKRLEADGEDLELELIESADEYKKELINELEEIQISSEKAQAEWDANPAEPEFSEYKQCDDDPNVITPKAARTREQNKKYTNFWSNIIATGINLRNYWEFQSINSAWTSVAYNTSPYFKGQSWNWKKLDSGLTAQINWKGYTFRLDGTIVKRGVSKTTKHSASYFGL